MGVAFRTLHAPVLLVATCLTFGGMIPFWNPHGAILEFGLPERIAISEPAHTSFIISGARVSALGMAIWVFYLQGKLAAVDTILALLLYVGGADAYVCWQEGVPMSAIFRAVSGIVIGGWGMLGLTARQT
ncbi:uncharacterized protein A1O5_09712 [Cladophialophora psammophila CBS 110553]|uniref:Uncharacterized protein n=1 Tax=Cladophialophora psammophila CBS 110553 TaxID=1182543 RepID=W9WQX3_9EURO|nr:uncharacterized protein A1O5_09712 [Cladophialophora psammophila CBS 110553]EXJ67066.1 hypothetical protein A1O5_09712 [Cladophialophora psammophila CBS 110553]